VCLESKMRGGGRAMEPEPRGIEDADLLRATLESTADGILVVDEAGRVAYANGVFQRMWRIPDELMATGSDDRLLEYVLDQLLEPEMFLSKVRELYQTDREDFDTLRFKDGRVFERFSRALVQVGQIRGRVWSFRDVTERERAIEKVREAEAKARSLIEQVPVVVYTYDSKLGLTAAPDVSPQIEALLGYDRSEWEANPMLWAELIHPDDRDRVIAESERTDASGEPFDIEYRMIAKDGRTVWVHDHARVISRDESGKPHIWLGIFIDITDRRVAEQTREALLRSLVAAQEEERRRIAADIHDDSVQKMTAVGLRLEALRRRMGDAEDPAAVETLIDTVGAAIARLRHLLFELRPPALDREGLGAALRQYLDETQREAGLSVALENRLLEEPPHEIRAIAYRIAQEAVTNALRHAAGTQVDVLVESRDGGVLVRVRDDGVGMPHGVVGQSAGHLGIRTMRERAELAGGWFRVDTSPGQGTVVSFWLPVSPGGGRS